MHKVAIFGDTTQDISQEIANQHGIEILSYQIQMDDLYFKDQIDIDSTTFYQKLSQHEVLQTGTPALSDVIEKLEQMMAEDVTDIIMMTSSQKLTGMYNIYAMYGKRYRHINLHLIDTETIGAGAGILVLYADFLRKQGLSPQDIVIEIKARKRHISLFALFRSLHYLVKGGRLNKYQGMVGNLLHINR